MGADERTHLAGRSENIANPQKMSSTSTTAGFLQYANDDLNEILLLSAAERHANIMCGRNVGEWFETGRFGPGAKLREHFSLCGSDKISNRYRIAVYPLLFFALGQRGLIVGCKKGQR